MKKLYNKKYFFYSFFSFLSIFFLLNFFNVFFPLKSNAKEIGEKLFEMNCNMCHPKGENIIIPEKTLKVEILEKNGISSLKNLSYLILNGKNGMPGFNDRLKEKEIEDIANYLIHFKNFKENENSK